MALPVEKMAPVLLVERVKYMLIHNTEKTENASACFKDMFTSLTIRQELAIKAYILSYIFGEMLEPQTAEEPTIGP